MAEPFADYDATYAYSRMGGKTSERAVLIVNGNVYEDWETVTVMQENNGQPPFSFRFTCSEGEPIDKNWAVLRIKPGMDCVIYLAGYKAFAGQVTIRQVFYDGQRHHIEIQGANYAFIRGETSVISKTGEWRKVTAEQFLRSIFKPVNITLTVEGGKLSDYKFERLAVYPGQKTNSALEMVARQIGAIMTSNNKGDCVLLAGPRTETGNVFVEGQNILEGREVVRNDRYMGQAGSGQVPAGDKKWGPPATSVPFMQDDPTKLYKTDTARKDYYNVLLNEMPPWTSEQHQKRVDFESAFDDTDQIFATVTVYGWLKPGGGLWGPPGAEGQVTSPMLMLKGEPLRIKKLTFTQDNQGGTRTTVLLVNNAAGGGAGKGRIDSTTGGGGGQEHAG